METLFAGNLSVDKLKFEQLYKSYCQAVYANIFKLVKDEIVAEDILQEVFYSFWKHRFEMKSDKSPAGWLFVVSHNKSLDFLKKKIKESITYVEDYQSFLSVEDHTPQVDEDIFEAQLSTLEEAVSKLSPQKQKVFRLCKYEGKSLDETAELMGLSKESVKDYLKQSKHFIKGYILKKETLEGTLGIYIVFMLSNI